MADSDDDDDKWVDRPAANYCVAFLDLLGQKKAMEGQQLLPAIETPEQQKAFSAVLKRTVMPIYHLQKDIDQMMQGLQHDPNSAVRMALPEEKRAVFDKMMHTDVRRQNWSDGLMLFKNLQGDTINANALFEILFMCASEAFLFMARGFPLRGAIDIGWGVEWKDHELVGPGVKCAYELESAVAAYPRIVVGPHVINIIRGFLEAEGTDDITESNRRIAQRAANLLVFDPVDQWPTVHYLGDEIRKHLIDGYEEIYNKGLDFARHSLEEFKAAGDDKLAPRYERVVSYYEAHPLPSEK